MRMRAGRGPYTGDDDDDCGYNMDDMDVMDYGGMGMDMDDDYEEQLGRRRRREHSDARFQKIKDPSDCRIGQVHTELTFARTAGG